MSSKARDLRRRLLRSRAENSKSFDIPKALTPDIKNHTVKKPTLDPLNFLNSYSTKLEAPKITEFILNESPKPKRLKLSVSLQPLPTTNNNFNSKFCDIVKVKQNLTKLKSNEIHFKHEELFNKISISNHKNIFPKQSHKELKETVNELEELTGINNIEIQNQKNENQQLHKTRKSNAFISKKKNRNEMIEQIFFKVKQFQKQVNLSPNVLERVNNIMKSIELPNNCIIDDDVQFISNENNSNVIPIKHLTNLDIILFMKQC